MKVLDLFSGLGGWSQAFRERGHDVTRVELDERYDAEHHANVLWLDVRDGRIVIDDPWGEGVTDLGTFDIILASPPCERFSIAARGTHWEPVPEGFVPRSREAVAAAHLTMHTLYLLQAAKPTAAIMENPRGQMRKIMPVRPSVTVWYCRYGDERAKPTDLWLFGAARSFYFEPECHNGSPDHAAAPRGSKTGTQGSGDYWNKSLVPHGLSLSMCEQMEAHLDGTLTPGRLAI